MCRDKLDVVSHLGEGSRRVLSKDPIRGFSNIQSSCFKTQKAILQSNKNGNLMLGVILD